MKNNMELLAPAGGMRELKAAVSSGANAVYLGAASFSARAGADNFTKESLEEAVRYAHIYGVKVHCAINTLIKENELEEAVKTAITANECGVDALIIQDIGFGAHLRKVLPDIEFHASTQMTVTSLEGVRYLENMGFSRVVLARELSIDEIKYIAENANAETEVFVHGAICMSYSGQCLMSSILGGRSGNRGRCAQPCRLLYSLLRDGKNEGDGYILSPKDMALINHLDELKKAGVASLKIEGRLKSAEYVAAVTGIYRKYLDNPQRVKTEDMTELKNAFSRSGFTDGYLTAKLGGNMMSHKNPSNNSGNIYSDAVKLRADGKDERKIPISIYASLMKNDVLRLTAYTEDGVCCTCEGSIAAESAINRPLDEVTIKEKLAKLGTTPFAATDITVEVEDGITVPVKEINETRRNLCNSLIKELVTDNTKHVNEIPIEFGENKGNKEIYITAEVRTTEQGKALLSEGGVSRIYASPDVAKELADIVNGTEIVSKMSEILSDEKPTTEFVSVASPGAIEKYKDRARFGEWRLNIYNSLTAKMFSELECITLSPELNLNEIKNVTEHISGVETEIIAYGHIPLMLMKNCPIKAMSKCQKGKPIYKLRDRKGIEFPLICSKDCRAVLLNSKPIYTADMLDKIKNSKINCIRLNFTVENSVECGKILSVYKSALSGVRIKPMPENTFTRAHLKRGV